MKAENKVRLNALKDIRRQLTWIKDAIDLGDSEEEINQLAFQLSASALNLSTESVNEKVRELSND